MGKFLLPPWGEIAYLLHVKSLVDLSCIGAAIFDGSD